MSTTMDAATAVPAAGGSEMARASLLRRLARDKVAGAAAIILTIVVLVRASRPGARQRLGAPAALGRPYMREDRG